MLNLLKTLLHTQKVVSSKARDRYKRNFDTRLREIWQHPSVGCYVYTRRDYATVEQGATRKLALSADSLFLMRELCGTNAVVQRSYTLERVSLDRIAPAPPPAVTPSSPAVFGRFVAAWCRSASKSR